MISRRTYAFSALALAAILFVGVNIFELRQQRASLPAAARACVDALREAVAAHYRQRISRPPDPQLLELIDRAIAAATATSVAALPDLLRALVGLRLALFPEGPPYEAPPPNGPGTPWLRCLNWGSLNNESGLPSTAASHPICLLCRVPWAQPSLSKL